jgi:hypothetical protein
LKEENFLLLTVLGLDSTHKSSIRQNVTAKNARSKAITKSKKVKTPRTQNQDSCWPIGKVLRLHYEITVELQLNECWPSKLAFIADNNFEKLGRGKPALKAK